MKDRHFCNQPIEEMVSVGRIGPHHARLWIRAPAPDPVEIRYWVEDQPDAVESHRVDHQDCAGRDHTFAVDLPPPDADPDRQLRPLTRYRYEARYAGKDDLIGRGRWQTSPGKANPMPEHFALAVLSCNLPFKGDGSASARGAEMLEAAHAAMLDNKVDFTLCVGDQMYTDMPGRLSLFNDDYFRSVAPPGRRRIEDCTADEVRQLLQHRYRHFWNFEGWRSLHSNFACYPILDDHDLVDNWGSHPHHSAPEWAAFSQGARAAYFDYQHQRVAEVAQPPPEDFDYSIDHGGVGVYVMDLRSQRRVGEDERTYSNRQEQCFLSWLEANRGRQALFIVLSVPPIHLPRWVARLGRRITPAGEDFSDRWTTAGHLQGRDRLLRHLHAHQRRCPGQRLVILSGDIHIGCVHEIRWHDEARPLVQLISSGITHHVGRFIQEGSKLSIRWKRRLFLDGKEEARIRLLPGTPGHKHNPYGKLNLGIVECRQEGDAARMRFKLYGHHGSTPVCVYRSEWW